MSVDFTFPGERIKASGVTPGMLALVHMKETVGIRNGLSRLQLIILSEQSRRNDMEALAYILIDCLQGDLPWPPVQVRLSFSPKLCMC